jgi:hypothetical protein
VSLKIVILACAPALIGRHGRWFNNLAIREEAMDHGICNQDANAKPISVKGFLQPDS